MVALSKSLFLTAFVEVILLVVLLFFKDSIIPSFLWVNIIVVSIVFVWFMITFVQVKNKTFKAYKRDETWKLEWFLNYLLILPWVFILPISFDLLVLILIPILCAFWLIVDIVFFTKSLMVARAGGKYNYAVVQAISLIIPLATAFAVLFALHRGF